MTEILQQPKITWRKKGTGIVLHLIYFLSFFIYYILPKCPHCILRPQCSWPPIGWKERGGNSSFTMLPMQSLCTASSCLQLTCLISKMCTDDIKCFYSFIFTYFRDLQLPLWPACWPSPRQIPVWCAPAAPLVRVDVKIAFDSYAKMIFLANNLVSRMDQHIFLKFADVCMQKLI
jgi:hypothetical protein